MMIRQKSIYSGGVCSRLSTPQPSELSMLYPPSSSKRPPSIQDYYSSRFDGAHTPKHYDYDVSFDYRYSIPDSSFPRRYTYSDSQDQYNSFVEQPSAASLSSFDSLHFVPPSGIPPDNDMPSFLSAPYRSQSPAPSTISDSTIIYSAPSSEFSTPSPLPYSSPYSSPSPHAPRQRSLKHEITDKADALKAQATSKYQEKDFEAAAKLYTYALGYVPSDYVCYSGCEKRS